MSELQALLAQLVSTLKDSACAILESPPGTGKTTRVPLALLEAPWRKGKILMLEPRRLAAKSAARYMAHLLGERVGQRVGYSVRLERKVSAQTQIEVVTEGILTRRLQADPALEDVSVVIFDEFHERSLQADLALALCRESQQVLREDLRLLIMSATLNGERLAELLEAPALSARATQFPVELRYAPKAANQHDSTHVAQQILQSLAQESGSVLVFLPGAREIRRVSEALEQALPSDTLLAPLFGNLSPGEQDRAIAPAPVGQRKVVLATNIAETSLTIEGVRVVIDSGLERSPRFDPVSGMTELVTQQISQASAQQRRGRAGRLEPGICIRLWSEADWSRMAPEITPEILSADLAPLALELAHWGATDPQELIWLDLPPAQSYQQARELLQSLEAVDAQGRITQHGKALARLPLHPRLGHMLITAQNEGLGPLACSVAALLEERDLLAGNSRESDLLLRVEALSGKRNAPPQRRERSRKAASQIASQLGLKAAYTPLEEVGYLIALAYPERIAQRRPGGEARFLLAGGRGAFLSNGDALADSPYIAVAQLDGNPREARIFLAASLSDAQLKRLSQGRLKETLEVRYNAKTQSVQAQRQWKLGALTLRSERIAQPDEAMLLQALCQGIAQRGLQQLPWSPAQEQLRLRVEYLRQRGQDWPEMTQQALEAELEDWLGPFIQGLRKPEAVTAEHLQQGLEYRLGYDKLSLLKQEAPTHWQVPSGSSIRLDYSSGEPVLAARLQELFGLETNPQIAGQAVLIHLLSPARRPVQVTGDLASFWRNTYPEVKKELKGRYPKHYWPDDPYQAEAIRGVRPRKR